MKFRQGGISRQVDEKVSQRAIVKPAGRPEGGNSAVARALNVPEATVRRAYQTASLSPEAQEAAFETGRDDNRSALLEAAKEGTPEAQTATIRRLAEQKTAPASQFPRALRGPHPSLRYATSLASAEGSLPAGSRSRHRTIGRMSSASWRWPAFCGTNSKPGARRIRSALRWRWSKGARHEHPEDPRQRDVARTHRVPRVRG